MNGPIDSFSEDYAFLSNFWTAPLLAPFDGETYPSLEHAYQAAKTLNAAERAAIRTKLTPGQAKRAGRKVSLRSDWEQVREAVMLELLRVKFGAEPLRSMLLATGEAELVEGNLWHDLTWGRCSCLQHGGAGRNLLGQLLMTVRAESQK